jgi:hypothetical protein
MKHALVDGDDPLTIEKFCSTYPAFELRRVLEPPSRTPSASSLNHPPEQLPARLRKARVGRPPCRPLWVTTTSRTASTGWHPPSGKSSSGLSV